MIILTHTALKHFRAFHQQQPLLTKVLEQDSDLQQAHRDVDPELYVNT